MEFWLFSARKFLVSVETILLHCTTPIMDALASDSRSEKRINKKHTVSIYFISIFVPIEFKVIGQESSWCHRYRSESLLCFPPRASQLNLDYIILQLPWVELQRDADSKNSNHWILKIVQLVPSPLFMMVLQDAFQQPKLWASAGKSPQISNSKSHQLKSPIRHSPWNILKHVFQAKPAHQLTQRTKIFVDALSAFWRSHTSHIFKCWKKAQHNLQPKAVQHLSCSFEVQLSWPSMLSKPAESWVFRCFRCLRCTWLGNLHKQWLPHAELHFGAPHK